MTIMKNKLFITKQLALLALAAALLWSCNFSKGVKKDLITGLYYSYNGFTVGEVSAYNGYDERLTSNSLPEMSVLKIYFNEIGNFTLVDSLVNYGCELTVTDTAGKVMMQYDDIFEKTGKVSASDARYSQIWVILANPIKAGNTYLVKANLFDKNKPENHINVEMNVRVTPREVDIQHTENELTFNNIWFGTKAGELPQNKVRLNDEAAFVVKGVKGFKVKKDKVYVGCSVEVNDKDGNTVLRNDDIFANNTDGFTEKDAENITIRLRFANPIKAKEEYHVSARIFDKKNTDAEITIDMDVNVVE